MAPWLYNLKLHDLLGRISYPSIGLLGFMAIHFLVNIFLT